MRRRHELEMNDYSQELIRIQVMYESYSVAIRDMVQISAVLDLTFNGYPMRKTKWP